ncbi:MAG: glycoside hydrolase family 78 protein [Planctomycetota bacterium]|nr:glycoside hydrolase family 78 protein [Planctomycetota bacterium]
MHDRLFPLASKTFLVASWLVLCLFAAGGPTARAAEPAGAGALLPVKLRCEYQESPLGVDAARPRLSWQSQAVVPPRRGLRQSALHVLVASSEALLQQDQGDAWDSGQVASDQSLHLPYAGRRLESHRQYFWKVRVWDRDCRASAWSPPASFTMGLLEPADWTARWIGVQLPPGKDLAAGSSPLPLLRREFELTAPVRRATVFVCGLGHYELQLNGRRVGDRELDPGWTNYRKTCLYSTYDVTAALAPGKNAIGVLLGNGMYNVTGGRYIKFKGSFGPPKLLLQLVVEHADGTSTVIATDQTWKATAGPIRFSCIFGGEDYDAQQELPGWDRAGFDDAAWSVAEVLDGPGGVLRSQTAPPIKLIHEFPAVQVTQPKPGVFVYDLGRNFSGRPRLTVRGPAGALVKLVPGELLEASGLVSQRSSGGPMWFSYGLRGSGKETWSPRFSYYGFRYVQIEGAVPEGVADAPADLPRVLDLRGQFLSNSAEVVGEFACSNPLVNQIHELINAAIRSNFQSVLTDCPHREKLGWLEVSHLLARGLMVNYDAPRFYAKISQDMRESQLDNGLVPDIAPEYTVFGGGFRDSPEWGSASVFNPWHVQQMYGDRSLLDQHYDVMRRYVDYLASTAKGQIVSHGLGDWYDIGPRGPGESQLTSKGLTATAIYYGDLVIVAETAQQLGHAEDAKRYAEQAAQVRTAFNSQFFHPDQNRYDRGSQTAQAMPLVLGLVEADRRAAVLENLVQAVRANRNRVTAGDVGFMYVVRALSDAGRGEVLYDLVTQDDGPGYAYQLKHGATTLTEAWDTNPGSSQNHCMLGHVEEWFYRGLAGIVPGPARAGFKQFTLRPQVVGDLTWVKAHYDSVHGRISSHWRIADGKLVWDFTVPPNTTATVYMPAQDPATVTEGGRPIEQAQGVKFLRQENGAAIYAVPSGVYQFSAPKP